MATEHQKLGPIACMTLLCLWIEGLYTLESDEDWQDLVDGVLEILELANNERHKLRRIVTPDGI